MSHEDLIETEAEFLILMSGIDETFAQMVHARSSYKPEEIVFGKKFTNVYNPIAPDGTISIDIRKLSDVEDAPLETNAFCQRRLVRPVDTLLGHHGDRQ